MTAGTEGTLPFRGHQIYYRVVGDLAATGAHVPLLVLHGGPGMPHDYLTDLAGLADAGRTVVSTTNSDAADPTIPRTPTCGGWTPSSTNSKWCAPPSICAR